MGIEESIASFFISLAAGIVWDGIKLALKKSDDPKLSKSLLSISDAIAEFHDELSIAYCEDVVMNRFVEAVKRWKDWSWRFRDIIEYTIRPLSDDEFIVFCDILRLKIPEFHTFTDRDRVRERIQYKLPTGESGYGDFSKLVNRTIYCFGSSWKQDVAEMFAGAGIKVPFAEKAENCDSVLEAFRTARSTHNEELNQKLEEKEIKLLDEYLDYPHFNKVQLICGTSGSGKTHYVRLYADAVASKIYEPVAVPCNVTVTGTSLHQDFLISLREFLEVEYTTVEDFVKLLDAISLKICLVIENAVIDWKMFASAIKDFARYEQFKFMVTISEYEYYLVEQEPEFLDRYCITKMDRSVFKNCLSIDEINQRQGVIDGILQGEYGVYIEFQAGISTPQEAIYYGECVKEEDNPSPPESYFEYIEKITDWKNKALPEVNLSEMLNEISEQKDSVIETGLDVVPYRKAQLMSLEEGKGVFSIHPSYHLRIYPFWAAKLIGYGEDHPLEYSEDIRTWLITCYIFYRYEQYRDKAQGGNLQEFFSDLRSKRLLEYAAFCAYKSSTEYIRGLHEFLLTTEIDSPVLCYAVLRFIDQCHLKIYEKFELCVHIAEKLEEYGLKDFYTRTLEEILAGASKQVKLRSNMVPLTSCAVKDVNVINGYKVGQRYMELAKESDAYDLVWNICEYILHKPEIEQTIGSNDNDSFMDYFLRKCFEFVIGHSSKFHTSLKDLYEDLKRIFTLRTPVGPYVKRNLTCAAGNLFENRNDDAYEEEYVELAKDYLEAEELHDRYTAWFLISNSVSRNDPLDYRLNEILEEILEDSEIVSRFGDEIREFMANHQVEF